jgi:hypothetical protein
MKTSIFLLVLVMAVLSSCTTAYKTGQTPDDVYYSAATPQSDEVKKEKESQYTYDDEYYDDRYLRMKVRNRYQWNDLNDWYYYDRYSYGFNNYYGSYYYGSYYNPYSSWNYYYNPYSHGYNNYYSYGYLPVAVVKPIVRPHNFNLGGYTNNSYNNTNNNNLKSTRTNNTRPVYNNSNTNNSNRGDGISKTIQTIFSGNNNNNSGSSGRTYNPSSSSSTSNSSSSSSSSSSGSSGSSSGGGGVSRPVRN